MTEHRFSRRAALDLEAIAEYTIERFGVEQARGYRDDLSACFDRLADNARLQNWPRGFVATNIARTSSSTSSRALTS